MKTVLFTMVVAGILPNCVIGEPEHIATAVANRNSTVLDTLIQEHNVVTVKRNLNGTEKIYAVSIDDVSEDANLYWLFYVDGELIKDMAIDEALVHKGQTISAYFVPLERNTK
ncbi:MAG: hypothetical protein A2534_04510 [Candidatus Magasanikbacteria bacterium RIFOXYD2_FULL_39_9]|uniref:Transcobalamin-like C-terminal domain-containing protein n=1 Tax=Candidatus Magasanikbacteria bacterium RIFOXYD1_FULL_40_23 TaxID=1798705 RepID=A0A1F6P7D5_9BACT|nr:MAG: hypothetical protein A2534_04510 [Candidatus Magasanikbacteria bacterium RIFOXYD2_FULL_39_9]OGH92082.1 MAG: hypothetical protein A2563_00635 [Candidatus Magasanikbacteria bacterium RIFOXYD1_FULL_40_23]